MTAPEPQQAAPGPSGNETEVECPGCGTTIRSRLGDQAVIAELRAQGWRPPAEHGPGHHVMVTVDEARNNGRASISRGMAPICWAVGTLWAGDPLALVAENYDLTEAEAAFIAALADDFHGLVVGDHADDMTVLVDQVAAIPGVSSRDAAKAAVRAAFESPLWRRTALEAHEAGVQVRVVYRERAQLVAHLASLYPSVISHNDVNEPEWPVLYVDTPQGQLSWHLSPEDLDLFAHVPQVEADDPRARWDGHSTEEKYRRIVELAKARDAK